MCIRDSRIRGREGERSARRGSRQRRFVRVHEDRGWLEYDLPRPRDGGEELSLPSDGNGVLVTKNAEQVLGFSLGDLKGCILSLYPALHQFPD